MIGHSRLSHNAGIAPHSLGKRGPVAFLTYKKFVFRTGSAISHSEILRFLFTHSMNLVISYGLVAVLCGGLGLPRKVGVLASCAAFAIIGYILMKLWVFKSCAQN